MAESLISALCKAVGDKLRADEHLLSSFPKEAEKKMQNSLQRIQTVLDAAEEKIKLKDDGEKVEIGYDVEGWICILGHVKRDIEDLRRGWSTVHLERGSQDRVCRKMDVAVGPWGGPGGSNWDDGSYPGVKKIKVLYGDVLDSISISYADKDGHVVETKTHGGAGGRRQGTVTLDCPRECLTSVTGHISSYSGYTVIRSLAFSSNCREFGPYGHEVGTKFTLPVAGGKIVGFKGRSGAYLDAIGVYLSPAIEDCSVND